MRIIRPQQLVVIKGSYQIGLDCWLGISAVAGCYLSRPEQFVSESQMWEAWKRAPLSFPVLDAAEPKPFAEYLIGGHAGIGQPVKTLDVSARIGGLTRLWRVEGERQGGTMAVEPFLSVPLDHPSAFGGKEYEANPLGRGYCDGQRPLLMTLSAEGSAQQERSPLTAPAPVPYTFPLRKIYLDKAVSQIAARDYSELAFCGLPATIDRRYFQMASPTQWLSDGAWPDRIPFELQGVGAQSQPIRGELPRVRGRAFLHRCDSGGLEEIVMQRKTLWFLPDSDIALMIFTGSVPLTHLLDESVESVMLALDRCDAARPLDHFQRVYRKRSDDSALPFEFLPDPDLMPEGMGLNIIKSVSDYPDSLRYDPAPTPPDDDAKFYQRIRYAIALHQQRSETEPISPISDKLSGMPVGDSIDTFLSGGEAVEEKSFIGLRFDETLSGKHFLRCHFERCDFSQAILENCTFETCVFSSIDLTRTTLRHTRLLSCTLQGPLMTESVLDETCFEKVTLEEPQGQGLLARSAKFNDCIFGQGNFTASRFEYCAIGNALFNGVTFARTQFLHGELNACIFNRCLGEEVAALDISLTKNAFAGGNWCRVRLERCRIESTTVSQQVDFSSAGITDCCFTRVGLKQARMENSQLLHSVFIESNFDQSDLTSSSITGCDMAGACFKDSVLTHSRWKRTSLQQGMFYNADLCDVEFNQCNLAEANLAMTWQDADTRFNDCLLERVCWVPRRIIQEDCAHEH